MSADDRPIPPKRRLNMTMEVGADDLGSLATELHLLADRLLYEEREEIPNLVSGGPRCGYVLALSCDPEQNHERYFAQVQEWLEAKRAWGHLLCDECGNHASTPDEHVGDCSRWASSSPTEGGERA